MTVDELLGFFDPKLCIFDLKARSRDDALEEIVDLVAPEPESNNRRIILDMLRNREALGSTAVGKGIAFPHGRSLAVSRLMAIFARSQEGIAFNSLDGEPTYLFFALLAPPQDRSNQYLPALGKIIELVRNDSMREKLMQVTSFDGFSAALREAPTS
ncbi:MAG: PTS sugar transporter subunit IIA [Candidatus Latescibacterota bacterium]|nr:MAG: PTS sugar transporter subunit IIA [Candidatus Latescibacterota bacterium]